MSDALKEIRKLASIALCAANDLAEYGFSGGESIDEDVEAVENIRNNLAEILEQACGTLEEKEVK